MSESPQPKPDQTDLSPPADVTPDGDSFADVLTVSPEAKADWHALLEKDVVESDYVNQMYPPLLKEVGRRWKEPEEEWRQRQQKREQWWQRERDGVLRRELDFFDKVYIETKEMAEGHNDPVVVLFDVDQTILDTIQADDGPDRQVVRPAFKRVVEALRQELGDRLQIGLLTSLEKKTARETALTSTIDPAAVAEEFLIGTRQYAEERPDLVLYPADRGVSDDAVLQGLRSLLRKDVYEAVEADQLKLHQVRDSDGKLEVLADLQARYPNTRFVFVDNMSSAGLLDPANTHVRGIWVGPEMQDGMYSFSEYENPRTTRDRLLKSAGLPLEA